MNNENKKLVAILDKATGNGWKCSLNTTKQCNMQNTLIMLMTTKLYNRVTAEEYDWTRYDSAPEWQEEETEEADAAG